MTLFKDGDWKLINGSWIGTTIMHRCSPRVVKAVIGRTNYLWYYVQNGVCNCCGVKAPDEMVGLKALQDWDR